MGDPEKRRAKSFEYDTAIHQKMCILKSCKSMNC